MKDVAQPPFPYPPVALIRHAIANLAAADCLDPATPASLEKLPTDVFLTEVRMFGRLSFFSAFACNFT